MENEIVVFKDGELEINVQVSLESETVWLNRNQIAELFDRDVKTIGKHISNALKEELEKDVVVAKFATTTPHGAIEGKTQTHMTEFYNLDMIISVGYRVKSQRGVAFRKWANSVLKEYLLKGYAVNQKLLEAQGKTIQLQSRIITHSLDLEQEDVDNFEKIINEFTYALSLLDDYDYQRIVVESKEESYIQLTYDMALTIIDKMNNEFATDVFGVEKENGKLNGILEAVYQNVFGQEVYPTIEEKAANLLYFLIKDHPFADGCKRIAAALFVEFLYLNNRLYNESTFIVSNKLLVALTIMIAESNPGDKESIIKVIVNLLKQQD